MYSFTAPIPRLKLYIILHIHVIVCYTFSQHPKCFLQRIYHNLQLCREFVNYLHIHPNLTVTTVRIRFLSFFFPVVALALSTMPGTVGTFSEQFLINNKSPIPSSVATTFEGEIINACELFINRDKDLG